MIALTSARFLMGGVIERAGLSLDGNMVAIGDLPLLCKMKYRDVTVNSNHLEKIR